MYCTQADILKEVTPDELAELTGASGTVIDTPRVTQAIEDAQSLIDSYAAIRFAVPLSGDYITPRVRKSCAIISMYYLWSNRSNRVGMDEVVKDNFEREVSFWKDVSKGTATIGIDPPPANNIVRNAKVSSNDRVFNKNTMSDF
jgi:phage gp36-like protein